MEKEKKGQFIICSVPPVEENNTATCKSLPQEEYNKTFMVSDDNYSE